MNTIVEPAFGIIPMNLVRLAKDNYRKRINEAALAELASSIKQVGIMQPILVRPLPDTDEDINCVEIVAGERRFRAAKIAGLDTIPAIVRDLSNVEAAELRLVENLQREDVHPIEEAVGYEHMMREFKFSADQLADKVGKSRSYIYGRLKFCSLTPAVRTAFYEGKLTASTALLVARIPVPMLQEQATREITSWNGNEPMSYRAAVRHVQARYMLELASAPFAIDDIKLVPAAGSCQACPKRTGNQPELFSDIQNADVCTDPDCFEGKKKAHSEIVFHSAKKKGIPVFERNDEDARKARQDQTLVTGDAGMWKMDRPTDEARNLDLDEALPQDQRPQPKAYIKNDDGEMVPVYEKTAIQEALEKAGLCMTLEKHNEAIAEKLGKSDKGLNDRQIKEQAEEQEREQKAATENAFRLELYKAVRTAMQSDDKMIEGLRLVAKKVMNEWYFPSELEPLYGANLNKEDAREEFIEYATTAQLQQLLIDVTIGISLSVTRWQVKDDDYLEDEDYLDLVALARTCGIEADDMRDMQATAPANDEAAAEEATEEPTGGDEEASDPGELAIGDRVRIKNDLRGPNGRLRKCCGREGTIEGITGAYYTVRTGSKKNDLITDLVWNELDKLPPAEAAADTAAEDDDGTAQDAPTKAKAKKAKAVKGYDSTAPGAVAWPFPTSRP